MKRYLFFELWVRKSKAGDHGRWGKMFKSMAAKMVDEGGLWSGGREFTEGGTNELPFGKDSITGYVIFNAESREEAEKLAGECPIVASNRVYEIMMK